MSAATTLAPSSNGELSGFVKRNADILTNGAPVLERTGALTQLAALNQSDPMHFQYVTATSYTSFAAFTATLTSALA